MATALLAAAAPAAAQAPPITAPVFGDFRSVLAQGEGESIEAPELAANQANGSLPATFVNQQPLYVDIMPRADSLTPADLDRFYKNTNFG